MAVKNATHLLDDFRAAGIAVEVTHRSKRRLFGLSGLASLRDVVRPPYRPEPGRGRGRPRLTPPAESVLPLLPPAPLTPIDRRPFDRSGAPATAAGGGGSRSARGRHGPPCGRHRRPWPSPLSQACRPVAAASSGVAGRGGCSEDLFGLPTAPSWSKSGATSHWCRSSAWRAAARMTPRSMMRSAPSSAGENPRRRRGARDRSPGRRPRPGGGRPRAGRGAGRPATADGRRAPGRAGRAPRRPAPGRRPAPDPGLFFPVPAAAARRASLSTPGGPPRVGRRREARPCAVGREGEIHGGCRWLAPRRCAGREHARCPIAVPRQISVGGWGMGTKQPNAPPCRRRRTATLVARRELNGRHTSSTPVNR